MVQLAVEQLRLVVRQAPSRTVARTVLTRRRRHVDLYFLFGDQLRTLRSVIVMRDLHLTIRRVAWVNRFTYQGNVGYFQRASSFLQVISAADLRRFLRYHAAWVYGR